MLQFKQTLNIFHAARKSMLQFANFAHPFINTSDKVIQMSFFSIFPGPILNALSKLDKCNLLRY